MGLHRLPKVLVGAVWHSITGMIAQGAMHACRECRARMHRRDLSLRQTQVVLCIISHLWRYLAALATRGGDLHRNVNTSLNAIPWQVMKVSLARYRSMLTESPCFIDSRHVLATILATDRWRIFQASGHCRSL